MFPCSQCGLCCQQVGKSPLGKNLDRGDGTCRYYDEKTRLCRIYNRRPLICQVDGYYDTCLRGRMSREEWYETNRNICRRLQKKVQKG